MSVERTTIAPGLDVSRIWKGGWHLSGGHGAIDPGAAIEDMRAFAEGGITTFDVGDIYTGVEQMIGDFRRKYPALGKRLEINDKAVPDYDSLPTVSAHQLEAAVDRSLARLGVSSVDMLQFAWWDTNRGDYIAAAKTYAGIVKRGKARYLGGINFLTTEIKAMLDAGVPLVSHQIQYSTALPTDTTATTQTTGDNTTKVATDAFVIANAGSGNCPIGWVCINNTASDIGAQINAAVTTL